MFCCATSEGSGTALFVCDPSKSYTPTGAWDRNWSQPYWLKAPPILRSDYHGEGQGICNLLIQPREILGDHLVCAN